MGSMIHLAVGDLKIDWGKNDGFSMHGSLFQPNDLTRMPYEYVGENKERIIEMKEAAVRPMSKIAGRLELMGYTLKTAEELFVRLARDRRIASFVSFETVLEAMRRVDIDHAATIEREKLLHGSYFTKIAERLGIPPPSTEEIIHDGFDGYNERLFCALTRADADVFILSEIMDEFSNYPPYAVLRLLAENPKVAVRDVSWAFADVVEGGWVNREHIQCDLGRVGKFLIVTEGSSDSKVLKHALNMLRPEVADFFNFVDMDKGYPFTGEGNLYRFCQGLVSIGIKNNVVVVYDNDAIGVAGYERTSRLPLPANMRVIRLPDCEVFRQFDTNGPNGDSKEDINGRAAAIECYLDLHWKAVRNPVVRWTSYENSTGSYHGELQDKEGYVRQFLGLKRRDSDYDYSKVKEVLESLVSVSTEIAEENPLVPSANLP